MARGRLISRTLGSSRKFADLHRTAGKLREFCQVLYPLIVANTDDFGRMAGDAFTVKHAVFPTSPRREDEFQSALEAMHNAGLIQLYMDDDSATVTIQVQKFDPHQPGLSKRTKSRFSEPPVNFTEIQEIPSEFKGIELKRIEPIRSPKESATAEASEESDTDKQNQNAGVSAFVRTFCELFQKHRHGARYHFVRQRDVPLVRGLLRTYPPERLVQMAQALLVAQDEWISETDRGIGILSTKATWLDARLSEYEAVKGRPVAS